MTDSAAPPAKPKRKYYKTKAEWAQAQADDLRARAAARRFESSGGSSFKARRKYQSIDSANDEADRWQRMANRFKARGE
jgi:hypothetical protein